MNWKYQEQYFIVVNDGRLFRYDIVPVDPENPQESEKKARGIRAEFLIDYPASEVDFYKDIRTIGSKLGRFHISEDGEFAVSVDDDSVYYPLPSTKMNDARIRKYLNDMYEKINS